MNVLNVDRISFTLVFPLFRFRYFCCIPSILIESVGCTFYGFKMDLQTDDGIFFFGSDLNQKVLSSSVMFFLLCLSIWSEVKRKLPTSLSSSLFNIFANREDFKKKGFKNLFVSSKGRKQNLVLTVVKHLFFWTKKVTLISLQKCFSLTWQ